MAGGRGGRGGVLGDEGRGRRGGWGVRGEGGEAGWLCNVWCSPFRCLLSCVTTCGHLWVLTPPGCQATQWTACADVAKELCERRMNGGGGEAGKPSKRQRTDHLVRDSIVSVLANSSALPPLDLCMHHISLASSHHSN